MIENTVYYIYIVQVTRLIKNKTIALIVFIKFCILTIEVENSTQEKILFKNNTEMYAIKIFLFCRTLLNEWWWSWVLFLHSPSLRYKIMPNSSMDS